MILDDTSKAGPALYIEATHSISTQVQNHMACKIGTNRVQVEYASVSSDTSINIKSQTWDWVHVWGILLHHVRKDYQYNNETTRVTNSVLSDFMGQTSNDTK